jgi:hypothetical protein
MKIRIDDLGGIVGGLEKVCSDGKRYFSNL